MQRWYGAAHSWISDFTDGYISIGFVTVAVKPKLNWINLVWYTEHRTIPFLDIIGRSQSVKLDQRCPRPRRFDIISMNNRNFRICKVASVCDHLLRRLRQLYRGASVGGSWHSWWRHLWHHGLTTATLSSPACQHQLCRLYSVLTVRLSDW